MIQSLFQNEINFKQYNVRKYPNIRQRTTVINPVSDKFEIKG